MKGENIMNFEPEFEDWALREMEEEGVSPEEYCNEHGYNWEDILTEEEY